MADLNVFKDKKGDGINGYLTIRAQKQRIGKRAESHYRRLDEKEASVHEVNILRIEWHRGKWASRSYAELLTGYLHAAPGPEDTQTTAAPHPEAMQWKRREANVPSSAVEQVFVDEIAAKMLRSVPHPPQSAECRHPYQQCKAMLGQGGWCDWPKFDSETTLA
jgi:hypothetical protein